MSRTLLTAVLTLALLPLAGCGGGFSLRRAAPDPGPPVSVTVGPGDDVTRPAPRAGTGAAAPGARTRPQGRTAEAFDTTTEAERAAATAAARAPGGQPLGETLAGLGSPTEPGFWLVTGLVDRVRPGRVVAASGTAVAVELRPSGGPAGGGSQISLAAMRALGVPLTALATLQVAALE